jgi:hypothetical protein
MAYLCILLSVLLLANAAYTAAAQTLLRVFGLWCLVCVLGLYLLTWHAGLFLVLFLGQIGVNGRKQVRTGLIGCRVQGLSHLIYLDVYV